ncbi:DNA methyltransferase Dim-2 [Cadophora gregata f. sp. sojae]|nr:DNA methyltransferase Dim-2 [Cadophora gregata f. sp. sojae]
MSDLPALGDGATYQCIPFPDHVMAGTLTEQLRGRIEAIPMRPRGMNLYKTWHSSQTPMTPEERERFPPMYKKDGAMRAMYRPQSRAYTRVDPKGIFPCMTVAVSPGDMIMGSGIHWDDQRMFTAVEGRRIQGAPEHEVFLGTPIEVWKILGNSVNRNVSLALGLSLRDAWLTNDPAHYQESVASRAAAPASNKRTSSKTANKSRKAVSSETIRRSTGRGVCTNDRIPSPIRAVDPSGDERGLTDWTCNFMISQDIVPYVSQDTTPESFASASKGSGRVEKAQRPLKRPHSFFQETSIMRDGKSKKSPRASKTSISRQRIHQDDSVASSRTFENCTSKDTTVTINLQRLARKGLRQVDTENIPDASSDGGADSDLEVLFTSVVTRFRTRNPGKPKRHRRILSSTQNPKWPPVFISLVSDDDDQYVASEIQCRGQAPGGTRQQRNNLYVPETKSPPYPHFHDDRVQENSDQRYHFPSARLNHLPVLSNTPSSNRPIPTQQSQVYRGSNTCSRNLTHASQLSSSKTLPGPFPNLSADYGQNEGRNEQDDQADSRQEKLRSEANVVSMDGRGKESEEVERDEGEGRTRDAVSEVPTQKYLPVDNGDFMAYFQTSRYMGQKTGGGRMR